MMGDPWAKPSFEDRVLDGMIDLDLRLRRLAEAVHDVDDEAVDDDADADTGPGVHPKPDHASLWAHACREPGQPVDLAVERALRRDIALMRRYRAMVAARACASSELAAAAAGGAPVTRSIGPYRLRLSDQGRHWMATIEIPAGGGDGAAVPRVLEVIADGTCERLALGSPIRNFITIAFDGNDPQAQRIFRLLARPDAAVYLM